MTITQRQSTVGVAVGSWPNFTATLFLTPVEGNLLVVSAQERAGTTNWSMDASWTRAVQVIQSQADSTYRKSHAVFYKFAGASESKTVTCTLTGGDTPVITVSEFQSDSGEMANLSYATSVGTGSDTSASSYSSGTTSSVASTNKFLVGFCYTKASSTGELPYSDWTTNGQDDLTAGVEHNGGANSIDVGSGYAHNTTTGTNEVTATKDAGSTDAARGACTSLLVFTLASSGTQHTVSDTDDENLTDEISRAITYGRNSTDDTSLTDSVERAAAYNRAFDDSVALTDEITRAVAHTRSASDNVDITDSVVTSLFSSYSVNQIDSSGVTDAITKSVTFNRTFSDSVNLTDVITTEIAGSDVIEQTDASGITDEVSRAVAYNRTFEDSINLTDAVTTALENSDNFVGVSSSSAESVSSHTIAAPAGLSATHQQLLFIQLNSTDNTVTSVAGSTSWTFEAGLTNPHASGPAGEDSRLEVWSNIGDTSTVTVTKSAADTHMHLIRVAYDAPGFTGLTLQNQNNTSTRETVHEFPDQITTEADTRIVTWYHTEDGNAEGDTVTSPTGHTERFDDEFAFPVSLDYFRFILTDIVQTSAGTVSGSYTSSGNQFTITGSMQLLNAGDVASTDSVNLTDSVELQIGYMREAGYNVAITETVELQQAKTKLDTITLTDLVSFSYPRAATDLVSLTDSLDIVLGFGVGDTDPVAISDTLTWNYNKGFTDSVVVYDSIDFTKSMERVIQESYALNEDVSVTLPNNNVKSDAVTIADSATVTLILNTLKPASLSIVDDRRIVVKEYFSMSDDEVRVLTIGDLAYKYWSFLSQLTPAERKSLYDHFKTYAPDGKNWIEDITEQP